MRISTKGRYALRVMLDLALSDSEKFVSLKDIAARQELNHMFIDRLNRNLYDFYSDRRQSRFSVT